MKRRTKEKRKIKGKVTNKRKMKGKCNKEGENERKT
jgi:hypothetical protein